MQSIQPVNIGPADNHGNYFSPFFLKRVAAGHFWRLFKAEGHTAPRSNREICRVKVAARAPDPARNCNTTLAILGCTSIGQFENQTAGPLRL